MSAVTSALSNVSNGRPQPGIARDQASSARNRLGAKSDSAGRTRLADTDKQTSPLSSRVAAQLRPLTEDDEAETARGLLSQMIIQMGGAPQSTYKGMYIDRRV